MKSSQFFFQHRGIVGTRNGLLKKDSLCTFVEMSRRAELSVVIVAPYVVVESREFLYRDSRS